MSTLGTSSAFKISTSTQKSVASGTAITTAPATPAPTISNVFPTALLSSKAAGIAAIRVSQVNGDILLEELNAQQETITGFTLHALVDSTKKITAIAVTQVGSSPNPLPLTPAQRSALGHIANESKGFKTLKTITPVSAGKQPLWSWAEFGTKLLALVDVAVACGAAAIELGANPIVDLGCIAAGTAAGMTALEGSDPAPATQPDPDPPLIVPFVPGEPVTTPLDSINDQVDQSGGGGGGSSKVTRGDEGHDESEEN